MTGSSLALHPDQVHHLSRPLRIVHVDAERGFSGGEVQAFLLIEGLRARGHENLLCCRPGSRSQAEAGARRLETRLVRMRNHLDLPAVPALARVFRRWSADLVHLHTGRATWLGSLAARWAGRPAVATRRFERPLKRNWRTRLTYSTLLRRAVAISPAVAEQLAEAGVPGDRIITINSAVDPESLMPKAGRDATRLAESAAPDALVLLTVGSLVRRKGHDVLLAALAGLHTDGQRPLLWIAGDGPERASLEKQAAELGLQGQVHFLGRRSDVPDLLAACDAFVLPSRREALGVAALEAMAAGRPVVASRVGGLAQAVVHDRTGLLVPADQPEALTEALARLLRDQELRDRLGAAGPSRVAEGFLAEQMVHAYEKLYREVLEERASR